MKNQTYLFIISCLALLLGACGSIVPQQPQITETTPLKIPETFGAVKLPIEIDLTPYLNIVDKEIPKTFKGNDEPCDGVAYSYFFKREPISFTGKKDIMAYEVDGAYNIRANYCAKCGEAFGSGPFCLTPRIYVSCGADEPLRRIKIGFESKIRLNNDYLLISQTTLTKTKVIDPCHLSFLNYDASKIIEEEISAELKKMEDDIDKQIGEVDLRSSISEVWDGLQSSIFIDGYGYLNLRPQKIDVDPITFDKQRAFVDVSLILSPIFSTDSLPVAKRNLPFLSEIKAKDEFNLPLVTVASYDSINSILSSTISGMEIPFKKKKIIIQSSKVLGPVGTKLLFEVVFTGTKKGRLYLLGTPTYNPATKVISFPDLEFDIRSKDALLKSAKWLFDKKFTDLFRSKALYDLSPQLELARREIEKQLNTPLEVDENQFVYLKGQLNDINFSKIEVGAHEITIVADLNGKLAVKL